MESEKTGSELLTEFAEKRLKEHQQELQTNYQERGFASDSEKAEAYAKHEKLFKSELNNKLMELKEKYNKQASDMEAVVMKFSGKLNESAADK